MLFKVRLTPTQIRTPPVVRSALLFRFGKSLIDSPKERMGGKKVDFGNSYQIIDVNVLMVHEIAIKRHTNHTAISQLIKKGNKMDYVKQAFSISDEFKMLV